MANQQDDLQFGDANEQRCKAILEEYIGVDLIKNTDPYAVMDYSNPANTVHVELKSRRINHNQYETALIGRNKVEWCRSRPKAEECYFAYSYLDGVFIIKYDEIKFDTFAGDPVFMRGGRTDTVDRPSSVVWIPRTQLRMIHDNMPDRVLLNELV